MQLHSANLRLNNSFALPFAGPSVLACGAWLKNTICVTHGNTAQISPLIGDLDSAAARMQLDMTVASMCEPGLLAIVAHDLHPDFYSTQFAQVFAAQHGLPVMAVQHHHAHIAAVCAEHGFTEPVLGLALDGVGMGVDGMPWGGELLQVAGADFKRLGHLALIAMPGGDRAAQQPWRMAAAVLFQLGRGDEIIQRFPDQAGAATVAAMLQRDLNCPKTSSMGRLFDAAAGLLGVCEMQTCEAQAAIALQNLAQQHGPVPAQLEGYLIRQNGELDFLPLLQVLTDCQDAAYGAALFHATIAQGLADWVECAAKAHHIYTIALGGGCFYNELLLRELSIKISALGMRVLSSQQPGDSSISLGQAWIAMHFENDGGM